MDTKDKAAQPVPPPAPNPTAPFEEGPSATPDPFEEGPAAKPAPFEEGPEKPAPFEE